MKDEIKEILEEINKIIDNTSYNEEFIYFQTSHISKLLDYITNLQEENEILKELNVCVGCNNNPDYKSRIERVIEYINKHPVNSCYKLLDILQGD